MKHIVSFSGGKDSTAMLLMMVEKQMPIDEILFCDTGMEFPEIYDHIDAVSKFISMPVKVLSEERSFEYLLGLFNRPKGRQGYGWPDFNIRWCTGILKKQVIHKYLRGVDAYEYVGIAADETHRFHRNKEKRFVKRPLVGWGITEKDALNYCYDHGFTWNGLYEHLDRVSCYCCPLSRLHELKWIYYYRPELWKKIKQMDRLAFNRFRADYSIDQLETKFKLEGYQLEIPFCDERLIFHEAL